jgi:hypothetical protein
MAKKLAILNATLACCLITLLSSCSPPPPYSASIPPNYRNTTFYDQALAVFPISRETFTFKNDTLKRIFDSLNTATSGRFIDSLSNVVTEGVRLNCGKINIARVETNGTVFQLTSTNDSSPSAITPNKLIVPVVSRMQEIAPDADIVLFIYEIEVSRGDNYTYNKTPSFKANYLFYDYRLDKPVCQGLAHFPDSRSLSMDKNKPNTSAGWYSWVSKLLSEVIKPSPFSIRITKLHFPVEATLNDDHRLKLVGSLIQPGMLSNSSHIKVIVKKRLDSTLLLRALPSKQKEFAQSFVNRSLENISKKLGSVIYDNLNISSNPKPSIEKWAGATGSVTYRCRFDSDSSILWYRELPAGITVTAIVDFLDAELGAKIIKRADAPKEDSLAFNVPIFLDCMPEESSGGYYRDPFMQQHLMTPVPMHRF